MSFLFNGSWNTSCTLLIAVKDMQLTCEMADEINERLPISRVMNEAYSELSLRYDEEQGHMQVAHIMEEDNGVQLRIPNFSAPSKYGVDRTYQHPPGMVRDTLGREKPESPERFRAPEFDPSPRQLRLARDACEFLALVNMVVFEEAVKLGVGMLVPEPLVKKNDYLERLHLLDIRPLRHVRPATRGARPHARAHRLVRP